MSIFEGRRSASPIPSSEISLSNSVVIAAAAGARLAPAPIASDWILAGTPEARSAIVAKSVDGTSYIMVWECTAGYFSWHYNEDETVVVISGEVFITNDKREELRLGPGDIGFFPARSSAIWRITDHVKKVAVIRKDLPFPVGLGVRAWHKLLRVTGLRRGSPLMPLASR
jgi:uncharacterized protein